MTLRKHYKFVIKTAAIFLLFLAFIGLFNYVIDPYAVFDSARIAGISELKPSAGSRVRMAKPYQVRNYRPKGIIAGNSRPELGLDPDHDCWPESSRPVFNLGLPGVGVGAQVQTLKHALYKGEINIIIWGMDFADFLTVKSDKSKSDLSILPPKTADNKYIVKADGIKNPVYQYKKIEDYLSVIFSLDTAFDSFKTLFQQGDHNVSTRLRNGFNPAKDYNSIILTEGQYVLFSQKNTEIDERFSKSGLTVFPYLSKQSDDFSSVIDFLDYARKRDVRVRLFINPYHSDYLSAIYRHDLWSEFEAWKIRLLEIAALHQVELWDFSGLSDYNTEITPKRSDKRTTLKWFWEPAHYKKELGDKMLNQLLDQWCQSESSAEIGVKLSSSNIRDYLDNEKKKIERWLNN
jgi:hypothetical protein